MTKIAKMLIADPTKCTGCRACEMVCSVKHEGVSNPTRARIKIMKWEPISLDVPIICQQCHDAPCVAVCPSGAMKLNTELATPIIDYDLCIGCRMCLSVCPFGAITVDAKKRRGIKGEPVQGGPICGKFCDTKAADYVEPLQTATKKKRQAAERFSELVQKYAHPE